MIDRETGEITPDPPAQPRVGNLRPEHFLEDYRAIRDAKREVKEAQDRLKAAKARAKDHGVDVTAIDNMEKLATLDESEAIAQLNTMLRYAGWAGFGFGDALVPSSSPLNEQVPEVAAQDHRLWAAEQAGYESGRNGGHRVDDNPFEAGSEFHVGWDHGWQRGHEAMRKAMGVDRDQTKGRKRRRI